MIDYNSVLFSNIYNTGVCTWIEDLVYHSDLVEGLQSLHQGITFNFVQDKKKKERYVGKYEYSSLLIFTLNATSLGDLLNKELEENSHLYESAYMEDNVIYVYLSEDADSIESYANGYLRLWRSLTRCNGRQLQKLSQKTLLYSSDPEVKIPKYEYSITYLDQYYNEHVLGLEE